MSCDVRIDFVTPPFAGHLFPLLDLAGSLRRHGFSGLRVLSTAGALEAIRLCGLTAVELLPGTDEQVKAIANTKAPVGSNPLRLYRQFRQTMSLMAGLREQLRELWSAGAPDLALVDFTLPIAGLLAQSLGIPWWTSLPSPCVVETRTGVPAYLGGWSQRDGLLGRVRDAGGRAVIRVFKRSVAALFARRLRALDFPGVYRADGNEAVYSPECILALGMQEFEFARDWPKALRFIGPLTASPPFPHVPPDFPSGKRCILVTLGTHLHWARQRAADLIEEAARDMSDCVFHIAQGVPGSVASECRGNVHFYGFVPYDPYLARYDAAVIHGGTGIVYGCIKAAVPMLVWPHDYDQHDHAARIVAHSLGLCLRPRPGAVVADLRRLLSEETFRTCMREWQRRSRDYDPQRWVREALAAK